MKNKVKSAVAALGIAALIGACAPDKEWCEECVVENDSGQCITKNKDGYPDECKDAE